MVRLFMTLIWSVAATWPIWEAPGAKLLAVLPGAMNQMNLNRLVFENFQGELPLQGDFSAEHMIFGVEGTDPVRREKLIELLDIDLKWRMHKVSDGQRRRVQICMGLLHPFKVLLLDEVTVDLDVVARMDLLDFFKEECEQRGATIVYATHIFDGLETWATHLAYIQDGELKRAQKLLEVEELKSSVNLLSVVESWLRAETKQEKKKPKNPAQTSSPFGMSSRHMAYYR
ncbi:ABC transporter I family member 19 isoform X2 [Rosa chinensis]|uniref:ABC transporter I family member 19 isoform X2 n=1 Tax=Rosa chinensis TaxID=74649 RepID=UPI000D088352|nr:ABC transporter I family member 19 isoform X2 [Rosa chinensis]